MCSGSVRAGGTRSGAEMAEDEEKKAEGGGKDDSINLKVKDTVRSTRWWLQGAPSGGGRGGQSRRALDGRS